MGLKVALLVVCLLTMAAVPATAQLADPLSLAASGVLLPFFSDPAAGFVSVLEIVSPIVPTTSGFSPPFNFTNPMHLVFFQQTCARNDSTTLEETAKQAVAMILGNTVKPLFKDHNGLVAIGRTIQGNDLVPLNWPIHSRTHHIDVKTGKLREWEPIILDTFSTLSAGFTPLVENPGAGGSTGLCTSYGSPPATLVNNGFCWSPLRSAATFVTPQEGSVLKATIYLICPTADIQQGSSSTATTVTPVIPPNVVHNGGVFNPSNGFPRIQNRDGSTGFPFRSVEVGAANPTAVRGRVYDDNEALVVNITVNCTCLTFQPVAGIKPVYATAPTQLIYFNDNKNTVPVWYTELESQNVTSNINQIDSYQQHFSFTGYWGLEIAGTPATLFHRMSNASLDNLSFGTNNPSANR